MDSNCRITILNSEQWLSPVSSEILLLMSVNVRDKGFKFTSRVMIPIECIPYRMTEMRTV